MRTGCELTEGRCRETRRVMQRYVLCNKTRGLAELLKSAKHLNNCDRLMPEGCAGSLKSERRLDLALSFANAKYKESLYELRRFVLA